MIAAKNDIILTDNSRLITESLADAGADVFIGYPITPANLIYFYSSKRFPVFMEAPDEITTLQWMSGYSVSGHLPVTASSFPGFALMIEGINMAYMMELPMVIILVQRLGPATGTATMGAQGDLALLNGLISGGLALPSFCLSNSYDCWNLPPKALETAVKLRTPVVILTSKEEIMTTFSINRSLLINVNKVERNFYSSDKPYMPYDFNQNLVPDFLPVNQNRHQIRFTASTHDKRGILQNSSKEALDNSIRLHNKIIKNLDDFTLYELDEQKNAQTLLLSFGITSQASREAVASLRSSNNKVSLLIAKTFLPVPQIYYDICNKYSRIVIAEENLTGQYRQILFGAFPPKNITGVNTFGKMINPDMIINQIIK
jgi:2-oxoglutarate ferredoxin oxidoreductase subunit alpha